MSRSISNGSWPRTHSARPRQILCDSGASMIALATSGGRIDLADADDAGVGVDLDDERLLAAVAALVDVGQAQVDGFDAGDFHWERLRRGVPGAADKGVTGAWYGRGGGWPACAPVRVTEWVDRDGAGFWVPGATVVKQGGQGGQLTQGPEAGRKVLPYKKACPPILRGWISPWQGEGSPGGVPWKSVDSDNGFLVEVTMSTSQQTIAMLENQSLWQAATQCHQLLTGANIPHAILKGLAVSLHGYRRNTVDVDLLIRREDTEAVREILERGHLSWQAEEAEFRTASGIAIQFLYAGDRGGAGGEVTLPDPGDSRSVTEIEDLPVLTLARLIESKIACGEGNPPQRTRISRTWSSSLFTIT